MTQYVLIFHPNLYNPHYNLFLIWWINQHILFNSLFLVLISSLLLITRINFKAGSFFCLVWPNIYISTFIIYLYYKWTCALFIAFIKLCSFNDHNILGHFNQAIVSSFFWMCCVNTITKYLCCDWISFYICYTWYILFYLWFWL